MNEYGHGPMYIIIIVHGESWAGARWLTNILGHYYISRQHRPSRLRNWLLPNLLPMVSPDSWDLLLYWEPCRWPPVLWKFLAQGLQLWRHQPGLELSDLWKELTGLFSPIDLSAETVVASDFFSEQTLGAVPGRPWRKTYPPSWHLLRGMLPGKSNGQEQWSLDKFRMRTQYSFLKGHQQTPSREQSEVFVCTTLHFVFRGSSKYIADMLILHFYSSSLCLRQLCFDVFRIWACEQGWGP